MWECEYCDEPFYNRGDFEDHLDDYDHWVECETCPRSFYTHQSCNQHMNTLDHWAPRYDCETCTKVFLTQNAANQHMNVIGHWAPTFSCETCASMFHTEAAADQHMSAFRHYRNYCRDCDRRFQNENNLRMHLNSKIHRGRQIPCPFCKAFYTTASGLIHHLETGACPKAPSLNRESIYRMVRERDPQGMITHKQIGWKEEENATYAANSNAWNGSGYECYLCHRTFSKITGLNQHLNSPAHKQQVYHCPNAGCGKSFAAMAGLFNHLESESCSFMRFDRVQKSVGDVISGRGMISFG
ncbi:hypothetical protein BJX70DRAFT_410019 [Aspergillus crustosus]